MDESWGHYAKRKESDREKQTLHDPAYMLNFKKERERKHFLVEKEES